MMPRVHDLGGVVEWVLKHHLRVKLMDRYFQTVCISIQDAGKFDYNDTQTQ